MLSMSSLSLAGKRVIIREDFNVPIDKTSGQITSETRIKAAIPTIQLALKQGASVILLSHLGRPVEGHYDPAYSLAPVAEKLSEYLAQPVRFLPLWLEGFSVKPGEVVLCENVRFNIGENDDDPHLAKKMAALGDVFVMDAFGTAHRAQASTHGIAVYAPVSCAGPLLLSEITALDKVMQHPVPPLLTIVGGSKVSSKLDLLTTFSQRSDQLIVGGGIANTFLAAAGYPVGASLYEPSLVETAKTLLAQTHIPLPIDLVTAKTYAESALPVIKERTEIEPDDLILDIGPKTIAQYEAIIQKANTILWNGPVGVFEWPSFAAGTFALAKTIARSSAYSIAGGGDTLAAIEQAGVSQDISYISTGGGAFLEYIEGKILPAIAILNITRRG